MVDGNENGVMAKLLKLNGLLKLDAREEVLAVWRKQIVSARITLAMNRKLNLRQQADLWQLIETGERFLEMTAHDFLGQLEQIDRELEAECAP
jgi:hypothetical protein